MSTLTDYIRHFFTPHHSNNHRPRILHAEMLLCIIAIIGTISFTLRTAVYVYPTILGFATNITIDELLTNTNKERQSNGLSVLTINPALSNAARNKAIDMFAKSYWAHNAPDGATPWDFIVNAGYSYSYAGENLARDFTNSSDVVTAWMNSPSHRDNVLRKEYTEIGFAVENGVLNGQETTLVVQMFGTPKTNALEVAAEEPKLNPPVIVNTELEIQQNILPTQAFVPVTHQANVTKAKIDYVQIEKSIALLVIGMLIAILFIDGWIIWRRKTIRIAGHNLAHFIFFLAIIGIIILSTKGSVL